MRADRGELFSAACGAGLLISMFAFAWFGGDGIPGREPGSRLVFTENAWQALTLVRWAMLATAGVAVASVVLHFSQSSHGARTSTGAVVAMVGALTAVLLIYRVLIDMPAPNRIVDAKLGAVLGTVMAGGVAVGGVRSFRQERVGRRRWRRRRDR
jgi:hypothetical protein